MSIIPRARNAIESMLLKVPLFTSLKNDRANGVEQRRVRDHNVPAFLDPPFALTVEGWLLSIHCLMEVLGLLRFSYSTISFHVFWTSLPLHINAQMFFFNANLIKMVEICSVSNQYCPRRKEVASR